MSNPQLETIGLAVFCLFWAAVFMLDPAPSLYWVPIGFGRAQPLFSGALIAIAFLLLVRAYRMK